MPGPRTAAPASVNAKDSRSNVSTVPSEPGLRERKKAETREALVRAAFDLFTRDGFDTVTVDDIAERAAVSRSTFFRYFPSKEAVVFPFQPSRVERFNQLLVEPVPGEPAFETVRRACFRIADEFTENRDLAVIQHHIVQSSPVLIARERDIDSGWEVAIAQFLLRSGVEAWRARITAAAIFAALRSTAYFWLSEGGEGDLQALGERSFAILREGITV